VRRARVKIGLVRFEEASWFLSPSLQLRNVVRISIGMRII